MYRGREEFLERDFGISFEDKRQDGLIKESMRRVIESGIYHKWEEFLNTWELYKLRKTVQLEGELIPLGLDSNIIAVLYIFMICIIPCTLCILFECRVSFSKYVLSVVNYIYLKFLWMVIVLKYLRLKYGKPARTNVISLRNVRHTNK